MLKSLTSFRFIAAFMVYLTHSVGLFNIYHFGYIGVSFFLVLSGFILAYNYHSKFNELKPDLIKKFYIARLAKIYPVHILTLLIAIPYIFLSRYITNVAMPVLSEFLTGLSANLLLIHSFFPLSFGDYPYSFNLVSWSLSVELFFYILFPFLIFIFTKFKVNKSIFKNTLIAVLFYLIILGVTFIIGNFREIKTDDWFFYVFPIFRTVDFIMGMFLGLAFVSFKNKIFVLNNRVFSFLEILSLIILTAMITYSPKIDIVFQFSLYYIPVWCIIILIFAFQKGVISKILSHRWLVFLGEISFSFYMIHWLMINYVGLLHLPSLLHHFISLFGSLIISALIFVLFEEPMRKKIRYGKIKKEEKVSQVEITM